MKRVLAVPTMAFSVLLLGGCAGVLPSMQPAAPVAHPPKPTVLIYAMKPPEPITQVGRYVSVKTGAGAAQINPLTAVGTFHFSASVKTVGDAIHQVLAPTGYQLSEKLTPNVKYTLTKPLPMTNRNLGPMKIETALEVLMGKAVYTLQVDALHRVINFQLTPSLANQSGVLRHEKTAV